MRVAMRPQNRRGALRADWSFHRVLDGLALGRTRSNGEQFRTRHQRWNRQRQGVSWNFVEGCEGSVIHLLVSTDFIEFDNLYRLRIVEVTEGRIDKCEMAVFS